MKVLNAQDLKLCREFTNTHNVEKNDLKLDCWRRCKIKENIKLTKNCSRGFINIAK